MPLRAIRSTFVKAPPVRVSDTKPGQGIVGMRERVALLGGQLETGHRVGGGFRVAARLPLGGEE